MVLYVDFLEPILMLTYLIYMDFLVYSLLSHDVLKKTKQSELFF